MAGSATQARPDRAVLQAVARDDTIASVHGSRSARAASYRPVPRFDRKHPGRGRWKPIASSASAALTASCCGRARICDPGRRKSSCGSARASSTTRDLMVLKGGGRGPTNRRRAAVRRRRPGRSDRQRSDGSPCPSRRPPLALWFRLRVPPPPTHTRQSRPRKWGKPTRADPELLPSHIAVRARLAARPGQVKCRWVPLEGRRVTAQRTSPLAELRRLGVYIGPGLQSTA